MVIHSLLQRAKEMVLDLLAEKDMQNVSRSHSIWCLVTVENIALTHITYL